MFHAFDKPSGSDRHLARSAWMAELSRASLPDLMQALEPWSAQPFKWLRAPETGLMMTRARMGGTGGLFNLGEVTVTRCVLQRDCLGGVEGKRVGVAYILGRDREKARWAALADALLQDPLASDELERDLLAPLRAQRQQSLRERAARTAGTRVAFLTVAREAGAPMTAAEGDQT